MTAGTKQVIKGLRGFFSEANGAFADLGVFVPLTVALISLNGLNATLSFLCAGLLYILSGLYFRIPMPVQPLKAVAAIAIAEGLSPSAISAAGLEMGVLLLILSLSGGLEWLQNRFSLTLIRGIQLGIGLMLFVAGYKLIAKETLPWWMAGGAALLLLWVLRREPRIPAVLLLLLVGLGAASFRVSPHASGSASFPLVFPDAQALSSAFILLVIPQVPLTLGNSILATSDVARKYYGEKAFRVTPRNLGLSLGFANLLTGAAGGLPLCHGAGGLTAHYQCGARTFWANLIIGATFILLAFAGGPFIVGLFSAFPKSLLAGLVAFIGLEHAWLAADLWPKKQALLIALLVGAASLASGNIAIGFLLGWGTEKLVDKIIVPLRARRLGENLLKGVAVRQADP